jgi:uncharacterized protein YcbK (DUF882 family)
MGMSFAPPATGGGPVKRGQALLRALTMFPVSFLASAMLLAGAGEADAKRSKGWHGKHVKSASRTVRTRKVASHARFRTAMKLGGPRLTSVARSRPKQRSKHVHLASLTRDADTATTATPPSLSGTDRITWRASPNCLADELKPILAHIAATFGAIRVNSTCRSHAHNRRVGGARRSYHLKGAAADFTLFGDIKGALAYLHTTIAGGIKHYGRGVFHIDTGPRRTW